MTIEEASQALYDALRAENPGLPPLTDVTIEDWPDFILTPVRTNPPVVAAEMRPLIIGMLTQPDSGDETPTEGNHPTPDPNTPETATEAPGNGTP